MKSIFLILCPLLFLSSTIEQIVIDKAEAQKAFVLLNDIRSNPDKYYEELTYGKGLKTSTVKLKWNDTLAKVAEAKAYDMANRNYFGHVDPDGYGLNYFINKSGYKLNPKWTNSKSDNYFESLTANHSDGIKAIKDLIIDKQTPSLGHRKHLLGLDAWNSSLTDIGIGFSRRENGSAYKTYICVVIAKHDW